MADKKMSYLHTHTIVKLSISGRGEMRFGGVGSCPPEGSPASSVPTPLLYSEDSPLTTQKEQTIIFTTLGHISAHAQSTRSSLGSYLACRLHAQLN